MKSIYILPIVLSLAACNNSGKVQNTENSDSTVTEHQHHSEHVADTASISADQKVFFENLSDGQEITLPFVVKFGVSGMEVEPAQGVNPNKGHHHLFIDQNFVPAGTMVPMGKESEGYYHFGKAQTSDTLSLKKYPGLSPGKHSLRLQFANGLHQSYGPAMSASVNIVIKK